MGQNQKTQSDARREREKVKLDRRYGEIGISAVKAQSSVLEEDTNNPPRNRMNANSPGAISRPAESSRSVLGWRGATARMAPSSSGRNRTLVQANVP
jgi:hypothetical protein